MEITYSTIITECKRLSAYDGKYGFNTAGDNQYKAVRIQDDDAELMKEYIGEGMKLIESRIGSSLKLECTYTDTGITVDTTADRDRATSKTAGQGAFQKSLEESLQFFVMYRWNEDKLPQRSQSYWNMFKEMSASTVKLALTKIKPALE